MQPDSLLRESLRFGFEREGVAVAACGPGSSFDPDLFGQPAELIIAGGRNSDEARSILSLVRGCLNTARCESPVLYVGNGIGRSQALAEGATEFLGQPVYVRDAVTVARLLAGRKADNPSVLTGDLGEHFGLLYLVRAISALKRRGVLTLVRGMRRGELRFYDGEVTSAQVGLLHGLAALHQLLLWTEGRFELRPEDVVRRQQIPLEPNELCAEAERFLSEIGAVAGPLSPSACYERDEAQIGRVSGRIPPPVTTVLRLLDGVRTVADVVEDCHFRVFETLGIANRLYELGLIRLRSGPRVRASAFAGPENEEWLVGEGPGQSSGYPVVSQWAPDGSAVPGAGWQVATWQPGEGGKPAAGMKLDPAAHARHRAERMHEQPGRRPPVTGERRSGQVASGRAEAGATVKPGAEPLVVDWARLLPDAIESELVLSPVVPSAVAAGEISVASGPRPLEARAADTSPFAAVPAPPVPDSKVVFAAPVPARAGGAAPPRRDSGRARQWSTSEEAFFARGADLSGQPEPIDDNDERLGLGQSFWRRLFRVFLRPRVPGTPSGKPRGRRRG